MDKIFNLVKKEIDKNIINKHLFIIAIDGDCASGKTTLANLIAKHYSANIIHMDDFFPTNTNEKDDNIDYTRFKRKLLIHWEMIYLIECMIVSKKNLQK